MSDRHVAILVLLVLILGAAIQAFGHDIYGGWRQPGTGKSCCDDRDCRPARSYFGDDGIHYVWLGGRWQPVPAARVLAIPSPDGSSHLCANDETEEIHCFVPGQPKG